MAVLIIIQMIILPTLGWLALRVSETNAAVAVQGDRGRRAQGDLSEIKLLLKGVQTQDMAERQHTWIWDQVNQNTQAIETADDTLGRLDDRVRDLEQGAQP